MSDLIERQTAIDEIETTSFDDYGDYMRARKLIEQLPSVQPEKRTEERTETHACDLISRSAAIEVLEQYPFEKVVNCLSILEELPSAQPEQQWIPCSERLPKPYEYCLWTTTDGRVIYHHCDGLFSNYTAWMPLPAPYEERREE